VSSRKPLPDVSCKASFVGLVRVHFFSEGFDLSFFSRSELRVKFDRVRPLACLPCYSFNDVDPPGWWNQSSDIKIW
jgi:hypothetical protein